MKVYELRLTRPELEVLEEALDLYCASIREAPSAAEARAAARRWATVRLATDSWTTLTTLRVPAL